MEKQPKTVEQMMEDMKESLHFIESRLSFIGDRYPHADGKEAIQAFDEVKGFINSNESKPYFNQFYDYALIFNSKIEALRSLAESAESEYRRGNMNENEELKKSREILEHLKAIAHSAYNLIAA